MLFFYAVLTNDGTGRELILHPGDIWWFMSRYVYIFVLAPIISNGIDHIDKKTFSTLLLCLLVYVYFGYFISARNDHSLELLLTVYLAGRYTKLFLADKLKESIAKLVVVILAALSVYLLFPLALSYANASERWMSVWISNNNILLLLICAPVTILADSKKTYNKVINYFSTSILAVYLLTDNKRAMQLDIWLLPRLIDGIGYFIVIAIFISCLIVDKFRTYLFMALSSVYNKLFKK